MLIGKLPWDNAVEILLDHHYILLKSEIVCRYRICRYIYLFIIPHYVPMAHIKCLAIQTSRECFVSTPELCLPYDISSPVSVRIFDGLP